MKKILLLLSLSLSSFSAFAHKDAVISLSEEGSLIGLPSEYLPAQLDLNANRLSIGKNILNMPPCVSKYFKNPGSYKLFITSSWYHEHSTLPPYIQFRVSPNNKDFEFELLFNLNNLSPIHFTEVTHPNEKETNYNGLEISEVCKAEMEKSTSKNNT